jgi:hypothetical protein
MYVIVNGKIGVYAANITFNYMIQDVIKDEFDVMSQPTEMTFDDVEEE